MLWTNLDTIVNRRLLELRLPKHFYLEFLLHSATCVRELSIEVLKVINTVELPVNSYKAIDLPGDFMDDLAVTIPVGQLLHPIPKNDSISPLRAKDDNGNFIPYSDTDNPNQSTFFGFPQGGFWWWNISDWGEPTGRWFGSNGGGKLNSYTVVKERRQIQLTETFTSDTAVLMYISDGQRADNATQIDTMAWQTISSYIDWKISPNHANENSPEGKTFYNQRRHLVARLDPLTVVDVKQTLFKAYTATMKA